MSRQDINQEFNTFVGGILTEANPINYPNGFTLDEQNFILERNGTRRRRYGLDYESGTQPTQTFPIGAVSTVNFDWTEWGDDRLAIIMNGSAAYYNIATDGNIGGSQTNLISADMTHIHEHNGFLVGPRDTTVSLTRLSGLIFARDTQAINIIDRANTVVDEVVIKIRDYEDIDDGTAVDNRPVAMTNEHYYNLFNRGWTDTNISQFFTDTGTYPSRADAMNSGLDSATGAFTSSWVDLANNGNTSAATGHYTVGIFNAGYWREHNLEGTKPALSGTLTTRNTGSSYISSMLSFKGRMFYLVNLEDGELFGKTLLCYSQVNANIEAIGDCFSINDPTSRDNFLPLDTDGGHIDISDTGTGMRLEKIKDSLFIFTTKGVYELYSRDGVFRPVSLAIRQVSNEAVLAKTANTGYDNAYSVTVANDSIYYWGRAGIIGIAYDSSSGLFVARNVSEAKIQTLYNSIPELSKAYAKGVYVPSDRTIRFLYSSLAGDHRANRELVYDLTLQAWYKNKFQPETIGGEITYTYPMIPFLAKTNTTQSDYPVDDLLRYVAVRWNIGVNETIHFAKYTAGTFTDFPSAPVPAATTAFLQTGYLAAGDSQRFKQADYIIPSFLRTEDGFTDDGDGNLTPTNQSSCLISAYWDYADDAASGKIGTQFEGYRYNRSYIPEDASDPFNYGQSVITTKNKLLGRGRALSLRFEAGEDKDCRLLGWGLGFEINRRV